MQTTYVAAAGIKRALAHQTMHSGLGAQPAEGVIALNMYRRGLDACHLATGKLDDLRLEPVMLRPAQIHAQQHVTPILSLGAPGAGLNIQIGVVGIHLAGEHAAEFEFLQGRFELGKLLVDLLDGAFVLFHHRQFEQFGVVLEPLIEFIDGGDDLLQAGPLLAQFLGVVRIIPDVWILQFSGDFL